MPTYLKARLAISALTNSMKANLALTRQFRIGVSLGPHNLTRRSALLKKCNNSSSLVPGGVFPTNNSRLILSMAA